MCEHQNHQKPIHTGVCEKTSGSKLCPQGISLAEKQRNRRRKTWGIQKQCQKYQNTFFNLAYFFGFSGALMGIITVSYEGIYTFGDILFLDLQHSIIILNVLWLIFAYKLKFSFLGILQSFIFVNIAAICVGLINIFIGGDANYMFLCRAPEVDNPLLFGGVWPYYIIGFEFIFFIYGLFVLLPLWPFGRVPRRLRFHLPTLFPTFPAYTASNGRDRTVRLRGPRRGLVALKNQTFLFSLT